jgi:AcrR family transcriptional regulator
MPKPPVARKQPSQSRSRVTVDAILDATIRLLVTEGSATTNQIAKLAGVSIGSLYQYFPNRDALFAAVIERERQRMEDVVLAQVTELLTKPISLAARELVKLLLDTAVFDPHLHAILLEHAPRVGKLADIGQVRERVASFFRAYLELHKSELRARNVDLAVFILSNALEAIGHAAKKTYGRQVSEEVIDEMTQLVLRYLLPDDKLREISRNGH